MERKQEAVVPGHATVQGLSQRLRRRPQAAMGEARPRGRVALTGDQGLEHPPAADPTTSAITESSLMLASSSTFWIRCL